MNFSCTTRIFCILLIAVPLQFIPADCSCILYTIQYIHDVCVPTCIRIALNMWYVYIVLTNGINFAVPNDLSPRTVICVTKHYLLVSNRSKLCFITSWWFSLRFDWFEYHNHRIVGSLGMINTNLDIKIMSGCTNNHIIFNESIVRQLMDHQFILN